MGSISASTGVRHIPSSKSLTTIRVKLLHQLQLQSKKEEKKKAQTGGSVPFSSPPCRSLGTAHAVAAVQALVAGVVTHRDVTTAVAIRRVSHHVLQLSFQGSFFGRGEPDVN